MKVLVVIPCFNVESCIRRTLESVFAQTHRDMEVICVDDGSTDGTLHVLKSIQRDHPGEFTIVEQPNRGACAARNAGLQHGSGEYVQFLDADDRLLPEKLAHQLKVAVDHSLPGIIVGSSLTFSPTGNVIRTTVQDMGHRDPWLDLMLQRMNVTSTILWSRSGLSAVGGWNEGLGSSQEYDLMFRMLKNEARVAYDENILTHIHKRPGSITLTDPRANHIRSIELRAQVAEHVGSNGIASDLRPYHQALFDSIRILYPYDPEAAMVYYRTLIPRDFVPARSTATGKGYLLLHNVLGFNAANRLRTWLGSLLHPGRRTTFSPLS
jgi:hypothetical protein